MPIIRNETIGHTADGVKGDIDLSQSEKRKNVISTLKKLQIFSDARIEEEVAQYFDLLGFHPRYFARFTSEELATHVHALIAAKKVAQTRDSDYVHFEVVEADRGVFMGSICTTVDSSSAPFRSNHSEGGSAPTSPSLSCPGKKGPKTASGHLLQALAEDHVAHFLSTRQKSSFNVIHLRSERPPSGFTFPLGLYVVEISEFAKCTGDGDNASGFDSVSFHPLTWCSATNDSAIDMQQLSTRQFLARKSPEAVETYKDEIYNLLKSRSAFVRVVDVAGPHSHLRSEGGNAYTVDESVETHCVQFGAFETEFVGKSYLKEINQCLNFSGLITHRLYVESFANGIKIYNIYLSGNMATQSDFTEKLEALVNSLKYITHFKQTPGRSSLVWEMVMKGQLSPEQCIFILALVKFVYTFFPKETSEYVKLQQIVANSADPVSAKKYLDKLFLNATTHSITSEKIYMVLLANVKIVSAIYRDFEEISTGKTLPFFNAKIEKKIDSLLLPELDINILKAALNFTFHLRATNFFRPETAVGAMSFRFSGKLLMDRPRSLFPEIPFGIFMIMGRGFYGFHVRFRPISRGGIRMIKSRDKMTYNKNASTLFEETYQLALTQQFKNKDIPEGGSKGTILLDSEWSLGATAQDLEINGRDSFAKYIDALLDVMMNDSLGIYSHLSEPEFLFFGPDENTANFMDMGASIAKIRGYPYWKSLTTGKSTGFGGVPHDVYGLTTTGVHEYVLELLKKLELNEEDITKVQTGGPDGDLGSNEILCSKDKTICVIDGSGVAYDPNGLNREELIRLAKLRIPIANFDKKKLNCSKSFVVSVNDVDVVLFDGSSWKSGHHVRDVALSLPFVTADLFVPCGGRPATINISNVGEFTTGDSLKFKYIVEGANLFFTMDARVELEKSGVHLFKDSSANKGGVTSSSMEVLAALCMKSDDHDVALTTIHSGSNNIPPTYREYVSEIVSRIKLNARLEFSAIWNANQSDTGLSSSPYDVCVEKITKVQATELVSKKINNLNDFIYAILSKDSSTTASLHGASPLPGRGSIFLNAESGSGTTLAPPTPAGNTSASGSSEYQWLIRNVVGRYVPHLLIEKCGGVDEVMRNLPRPYLLSIVSVWIASTFVYKFGLAASEFSFYRFMRDLEVEATDVSITKSGEFNSVVQDCNIDIEHVVD